MTKLIFTIRNFANKPMKQRKYIYTQYKVIAWDSNCLSQERKYLSLLNKVRWKVAVRYRLVRYSRCGVCGQGILRCKCRTVNWKYVTVGVGML